jgi:acetyltransferase
MTIRNLDAVFNPTSVAVIGASEREGTLGRILLENVLAHFTGPVYPLNPSHATLLGRQAYRSVAELPQAPDLAIIATPPSSVSQLVHSLAERGTRGVCVITAGFGPNDDLGLQQRQDMLDAAQRKFCLGLS